MCSTQYWIAPASLEPAGLLDSTPPTLPRNNRQPEGWEFEARAETARHSNLSTTAARRLMFTRTLRPTQIELLRSP